MEASEEKKPAVPEMILDQLLGPWMSLPALYLLYGWEEAPWRFIFHARNIVGFCRYDLIEHLIGRNALRLHFTDTAVVVDLP